MKLLFDFGADVKLANNDKSQSLITATRNSSAEIVKLLIDAGADVNLKPKVNV